MVEGIYERYLELCRTAEGGTGISSIVADQMPELSMALDASGIQESCSVRNCLKARRLAIALVNDEGRLQEGLLDEAILALQSHLYSLGPGCQYDAQRNGHMLQVLAMFKQDSSLTGRFERIMEPYLNPMAEDLIRDTLHLKRGVPIDRVSTRRAVLAAFLTYLRQNVGSCFATAPAIVIQKEQPHQFLADLEELLMTGQLKRVVAGIEHVVPLSPSWGQGDLLRPFVLQPSLISPGLDLAGVRPRSEDVGKLTCAKEIISMALQGEPIDTVREAERAFKSLTDNALLKAWEFSLASFAEAKTTFSRWNFYSSLGFGPEEEGGIGEVIAKVLQERLDQANREVEELQDRYEVAFSAVKFAEGRLRRATADEAQWLEVAYRRKVGEMNGYLDERDTAYARAQKLSGFLAFLVEHYNKKFPEYFQEVYDAEMHDVGVSPYDDSPAGFRLLYKYGRTHTAVWELIESEGGFVDALVDFFVSTERVLESQKAIEGIERDFSDLVTAVVSHVRTDRFLLSALQRMAKVHGGALPSDPLHNLDGVAIKPWAYVSGGTMRELITTYYGREKKPTLRERLVESPTDLYIYLLDAMKELPARVQDAYLERPMTSMLIQSPTHAFTFKPGLPPFRDGWLDEGNTYTFVRDRVITPQAEVISSVWLDRAMMKAFVIALKGELPKGLPLKLSHPSSSRLRPRAFREALLASLKKAPWTQNLKSLFPIEEKIDGLLYQLLPFTPGQEIRPRLVDLGQQLDQDSRPLLAAFDALDFQIPDVISSKDLYDLTLSLLATKSSRPTSRGDLPWLLRQAMRDLGLALPAPVIFGDTNWVKDYFGFLVNPGTGQLELWRIDYIGMEGYPMTRWKNWVDGSIGAQWALYNRPSQYVSVS